jgi:hypothetical protein
MLADIGLDRKTAISALLAARRNQRTTTTDWLTKARSMFDGSLNNMLGSYTLNNLKSKGFIPNDFIEHKIKFEALKCYTVEEMTKFGFTFQNLREMGFRPIHFKDLQWQDYTLLNLSATAMLETDMNIDDVFRTGLAVQQLKELGFTQQILEDIGLTQNTRDKLCSEEDFILYFGSKFKRGSVAKMQHKEHHARTTANRTNEPEDSASNLAFEF